VEGVGEKGGAGVVVLGGIERADAAVVGVADQGGELFLGAYGIWGFAKGEASDAQAGVAKGGEAGGGVGLCGKCRIGGGIEFSVKWQACSADDGSGGEAGLDELTAG
jgi:hypothetical protein